MIVHVMCKPQLMLLKQIVELHTGSSGRDDA
jgi:hypothetical protein